MLLSRGYEPDRRVQKEAHTLAADGFRVTVIAWDREQRFPAHAVESAPALLASTLGADKEHFTAERAEIFEGDREKRAAVLPVSIIRVCVPAGYGTGRDLLRKMPLFWWRAWHELRRARPDVVHAHDLDTLPLAYLYGRGAGIPVVFDAHEFYPGMVRANVGKLISRALEVFERACAPRVDAVITVGERLADHYRAMGANVWIVHNSQPSADPGLIEEMGRAKRQSLGLPDDALVVVYIGMLSRSRLIAPLLDAAAALERVWLVIGGEGAQQAAVLAAAEHNPRIRWLGWVEPEDVQAVVAAGDVVYYGLDAANPNSRYFMPNLAFLALTAGRPLLVTPVGEIAAVVQETGCGIVMETATAEAARRGLIRLFDSAYRVTLGQQARYICQERYNWSFAAAQLWAVYRSIQIADIM
jgi:glycosyltransferase involved in cell wall biosynthesis